MHVSSRVKSSRSVLNQYRQCTDLLTVILYLLFAPTWYLCLPAANTAAPPRASAHGSSGGSAISCFFFRLSIMHVCCAPGGQLRAADPFTRINGWIFIFIFVCLNWIVRVYYISGYSCHQCKHTIKTRGYDMRECTVEAKNTAHTQIFMDLCFRCFYIYQLSLLTLP